MRAPNDRAKRIAAALRELVDAMPGCRGVELARRETHTLLCLTAVDDASARALADTLGLEAKLVSVYEGTPKETWWLKATGGGLDVGLFVHVDGPHHVEPRPPAPDDAQLDRALAVVAGAEVVS